MSEDNITLEKASGVGVTAAKDGQHTGVMFKVPSGVQGALLSPADLTKLISILINDAGKHAPKAQASNTHTENLTPVPLPVTQLGLGRGRASHEVVFAVRTGHMTLSFAADATQLRDFCTMVLNATAPKSQPARH